MSNISILPIHRTHTGATIQGQSRSGSNGNVWELCILQGSNITGASLSDCFVSYTGHSVVEVRVLPFCRDTIGVFYGPDDRAMVLVDEFVFENPREFYMSNFLRWILLRAYTILLYG